MEKSKKKNQKQLKKEPQKRRGRPKKDQSLKKPTLNEFLENSKSWFKQYSHTLPDGYTEEQYLQYQRELYVKQIEPLEQDKYEAYVRMATQSLIKRMQAIIEKASKKQ